MTADIEMIIEIWSNLRDYIPVRDRLNAADAFVMILDDNALADMVVDSGISLDKELGAALENKLELGFDEDEENDWEV